MKTVWRSMDWVRIFFKPLLVANCSGLYTLLISFPQVTIAHLLVESTILLELLLEVQLQQLDHYWMVLLRLPLTGMVDGIMLRGTD